MSRKPREGSKAWEATLPDSPTYARNTILDLAKRAEQGSTEAVDILTGWLAKYPDLRSLVRGLDGLAARTERAWVDRLCGVDELARTAAEEELAKMRAELLGPAPSVTDRVLASTVLVAYLGHQRAARVAALPIDGPEVTAAREKLLSLAQKRLQDAVRGWALYAGKAAKGLRPPGRLKLFEPDRPAA